MTPITRRHALTLMAFFAPLYNLFRLLRKLSAPPADVVCPWPRGFTGTGKDGYGENEPSTAYGIDFGDVPVQWRTYVDRDAMKRVKGWPTST